MFPILYKDNYLLAILKPAGLSSESGGREPDSAEQQVAAWLRRTMPWKKRQQWYLLHRLDRPVSGVLLFALTPCSMKQLALQFEKRLVRKTYLAVAGGPPPTQQGELVHWLRKDTLQRRALVAIPGDSLAQECRLRYKLLEQKEGHCLMEIELLTGRYHQIRAQLAAVGSPIMGDDKYGGEPAEGLALHAWRLELEHPKTGETLRITAPPPQSGIWRDWSGL
jgi:23S rRNA pseudouridine1911/1915/1917 synthase